MTQDPPWQELVAKDLHENEWRFRHIFRGLYYIYSVVNLYKMHYFSYATAAT